MTDAYAPPSGPPPPQVPEGWKAVFDERYHEWFYVNIYTKQSQWEKPTRPAEPDYEHAPPDGPPPSYSEGVGNPGTSTTAATAVAAENPRINVANGETAGSSKPIPITGQQNAGPQLPPRPTAEAGSQNPRGHTGHRLAKGLLHKLFGKQGHQYPGQMYPPGYSHSAFAQGHHSYPPRQGMFLGAPGGYYGHGSGLGGMGMFPPRRHGPGIPGAALGAGAGLAGGALLANAVNGHHYGGYGPAGYGYGYGDAGYGSDAGSGSEGAGGSDAGDFGDGGGGGDFDGGDFGGGDFGGGDFGGDF